MLSIGIEFLTGRYVAEDPHRHRCPEWPPHPGRLFMAMAASYFENGEVVEEKEALEWFEKCEPPKIHINKGVTRREIVKAFVPINEMPYQRVHKERAFPTTITGYKPIYFIWNDIDNQMHFEVLKKICSRVHRLGHSSSFVDVTLSNQENKRMSVLSPDKYGDKPIRWVFEGALSSFRQIFTTDKTKKQNGLKQYYITKARLNSVNLPEIRYLKESDQKSAVPRGLFSNMYVLPIVSNKYPSLHHTKNIIQKIRQLIQNQNAPKYVSGLDRDNKDSKEPHIAIIPLAFAGYKYADGLIRGIGIVFPEKRDQDGENYLSSMLFKDEEIQLEKIKLSTRMENDLKTLKLETWSRQSRIWFTVTPIVLDRMPHAKDNEVWISEIQEIIKKSCTNQGLPEPEVIVSSVSFLKGVPKSSDFPKYSKTRMQTHALLRFKTTKIQGPLILGAGRYNGYGLCMPRWDKNE